MQFNPMDILKNAKKIQEQMGDLQQKMEGITVTGCAGAGMVEIDMNGRMDVIAVRIETSIVSQDNVDMLEDLVHSAFTDAVEKVRAAVGSEMGNLAGAFGTA